MLLNDIICFTLISIDKIKGLHAVWFLGDNFAATIYRKHFLLISDVVSEERHRKGNEDEFQFFVKDNFEFHMFCNSKYNSPMQNMLIRLQNTFVAAINQNISLPRYVLIILDSDLIDFLAFNKAGMAQLAGDWITWLVNQFSVAIAKRKEQLPSKAQCKSEPCVYWCLPPSHVNFGESANECRKKFGFCVETILKGRSDMRVIKIKDGWNFNDKSLVHQGKLTETGKYAYWEAVDLAFKFNTERHELFLAKSKCIEMKKEVTNIREDSSRSADNKIRSQQRLVSEDTRAHRREKTCAPYRDDMENFFMRRRRRDDQYHWSSNERRREREHSYSGNRFMLPRPYRH